MANHTTTLVLLFLSALLPAGMAQGRLDRRAIVARHNPVIVKADPWTPLSVGNGKFAFTVDVTGLQTFFEFHSEGMSLGTQSDWSWHSSPNPEGFRFEEVLSPIVSNGRKVNYPALIPKSERGRRAWQWFRENPHRLHLGRIGLEFVKKDGSPAALADLTGIRQVLDLWSGTIVSRFELEGVEAKVTTRCHPQEDVIAVRIESPLIAAGRLKVLWAFPYGTGDYTAADWKSPDAHQTTIQHQSPGRARLARQLDADRYFIGIAWNGRAGFRAAGKHRFILTPDRASAALEFVTAFSPAAVSRRLPTAAETDAAADRHWRDFWISGGAIDLSASADTRWKELERRIVLSQYLTAIQCAGLNPPQESGLTHNSWYGKFHLEMTTWHGVHFALWGRPALLERWMKWLRETGLEAARRRAREQGYEGARWNKFVDSRALWDSPSETGAVRTTQQGHMIYLPELIYRVRPGRQVLEQYRNVVFESAEFMAAFAAWDPQRRRYVLGPPIQSGAETTPALESRNPTVELSYWGYGLSIAQQWRERLGMPRNPEWDRIINGLAPLPTKDGHYVDTESHPEYLGRPALFEVFGCMPGYRVDTGTMERTLHYFTKDPRVWKELKLWGTDFPMLAMTAARLGKPDLAIEFLLQPHVKNTYMANGHMMHRQQLPAYLPANGGLLWAVAMMAAGWDGAGAKNAPGFPAAGPWVVKSEGLRPAL